MSTTHTPRRGEWNYPGHTLPTLEGHTDGTISITVDPDKPHRKLLTVQCSVCHATYTDHQILAVNAINFARTKQGAYSFGAEPFRRCSTCRDAGREPENAPYLRHVKKMQDNARSTLVRSDEFNELQNRALRAKEPERSVLQAQLEDMLRKTYEKSEAEAEAAWNTAGKSAAA